MRQRLELLQLEYPHPVVFHWYSETLKNLDVAVGCGHFFSINPAMVRSKKGRDAIVRIPRERILTESDGPFISMGNRRIEPSDIRMVEQALAKMWTVDSSAARSIVAHNFRQLMEPLKKQRDAWTL